MYPRYLKISYSVLYITKCLIHVCQVELKWRKVLFLEEDLPSVVISLEWKYNGHGNL